MDTILYGYCMSQKLPYKNFKWSTNLSLDKLQIGNCEVDIPKFLKNYIISLKIIHYVLKLKI